jgi:hypothetical protein
VAKLYTAVGIAGFILLIALLRGYSKLIAGKDGKTI